MSSSSRRVSAAIAASALLSGAFVALTLPSYAAAPTAPAAVSAPAPAPVASLGQLRIENSFVSAVGWVKPGEIYPSRILVTNTAPEPVTASIQIAAPRGSRIVGASSGGFGSLVPAPSEASPVATLSWTGLTLPAGATKVLVLRSRASSTVEEPTIVWRDISSVATLTTSAGTAVATSRGPKVIPPSDAYDTARYGDRPFPVVPVQYRDRAYQTDHSGEDLATIINDPAVPGSTFNLYQEMSLGQLFPHGTVPSSGLPTADFASYAPGFPFTEFDPTEASTCTGLTGGALAPGTVGGPAYTERITNGVYNLPGQTGYYGSDGNGSAVVGSVAGVGALQQIDSGCGPTAKLVLDAAAIADPEIDYSDYDTDKDGVVDFFMVVYAGCGGHGSSQLSIAGCDLPNPNLPQGGADLPYDNIWPHSSTLEGTYSDPVTGLPGFTTDDQLKDLEGRPLWYTDTTYSAMDTTPRGDALKVFVRVGPYNVNPEDAIDKASVISHEYGHSLGLPDFYSGASRETYGDWNLMATDKSQNMDAFSRQELGWVVPEVLDSSRTVTNWTNSKQDIDTITWQTPDGTPYTLTEGVDGRVQNSQMYVAKLPGRNLMDPAVFDSGEKASKVHVWHSGSGNDFGCSPSSGHNFDLAVPGLQGLPEGTTAQLEFKSLWDIEWDYDYGYVLTTVDGGETYVSHPSDNGYTTSNLDPTQGNPNANGCQQALDNGITGTSGSYAAGTEALDRKLGDMPAAEFVSDSYDVSDLVNAANGALRFSYSTDPGVARPGWFIDDIKVTVTEPGQAPRVVYSTDFETSGGPTAPEVFNGGCRKDLTVAKKCTQGFKYVAAGAAATADHAYYLEMRDRSGFDFEGFGQIDRTPIGFLPGLYMAYTDEAHGYGNIGTDDPPAQSPLDSQPTPGESDPDLNDAAWTAATGDNTFTDSGAGHTDNYSDPANTTVDSRYPDVENPWRFTYGCLGFAVTAMSGLDVAVTSNLTGDVTFTMGAGCSAFDYGYLPAEPALNHAPVAALATTPASPVAGQAVTFNAGGSTDEDNDALSFSWEFGDGTPKTADSASSSIQHAYAAAGDYVATVHVSDGHGGTDSATVPVHVTAAPVNAAPVARMSITPASPMVTQTVTLSAAGSSDAETPASSLKYRWNFGDGGSTVDATTRTVSTKFTRAGVRTVSLTVIDAGGKQSTISRRVVVRREVACNARTVAETGSWRVRRASTAPGGSYCDNLGTGAGPDTLKLTFTGQQVDVFYGKKTGGGAAAIYIDGIRVGQISFDGKSRAVAMRFHRVFTGLGSGKHTVKLVVTRGRAYVDGFIIAS